VSLELPNGVAIKKAMFYNNSGQKVKETSTATSWDVTSFSAGVYFIRILTNFGTKKLTFVKN
jgi:hypothetical protein